LGVEKKHPPSKTFEQMGVRLEYESGNQVIGNCVLCDGESKLYINQENGLWDCKKCGTSGNAEKFVELVCKLYSDDISREEMMALSKSRGIRPKTFRAWGVGCAGKFYTIPMMGNEKARVINAKRYTIGGRSLTTARCKQCMIRPLQLYDSEIVYICEGEWDGMSMWELLDKVGVRHDVWAVTGSHVFNPDWISIFRGKHIRVIFDNDKPGIAGSNRLFKILQGNVASLQFLHWPDDAPDGLDLRDYYMASDKSKDTVAEIESLFKSYPMGLDAEEGETLAKGYREPVYTGQGVPPDVVEKAYRKWLHLKDADIIDIMFGTVFANRLDGDPIWLLIVAPPGGSKTALVRTLSGAEGIMEATTLTPASLISGFSAGPDPSLIPKLNKHVLVVKDFTTILSANQSAKEEIFGILRDAYDGYCEKWLGNNVHRKYKSRFGIIAGVTPAIEREGASGTVLGERFIRYRISSTGNLGKDDDVILRALRNVKHDAQMNEELEAIAHEAVNWDVSNIPYPDCDDDMLRRIGSLAQWVSKLRGVVPRQGYSRELLHKPMSEIGTRLAKQLLKLGYGIAVYRREPAITERTYELLTKVAMGTSPDRIEEVIKQMYVNTMRRGESFTTGEITAWCRFPEQTIRYVLQDMELLDMVKCERRRWRLSPSVWRTMRTLKLYQKEIKHAKKRR